MKLGKALAWLSGFTLCLSLWASRHCPAHPWSTIIGVATAVILAILSYKKK